MSEEYEVRIAMGGSKAFEKVIKKTLERYQLQKEQQMQASDASMLVACGMFWDGHRRQCGWGRDWVGSTGKCGQRDSKLSEYSPRVESC